MEILVAWRIDVFIMKGSIDKIVEAGDRFSKKTCWVIHTVNGVIQLRGTQN